MNPANHWILVDGTYGGNQFVAMSSDILGGDSILVNGSYVNVPGVYFDLKTGNNGCDSTTMIDLNIISPTNGDCGTVLNFDGADDYIVTDSSLSIGQTYSILGWFKGTSTERTILAATQSGTVDHYMALEIDNDGHLSFLHRSPAGSTGGTKITSENPFNDGEWHHIAMVKTTARMLFYIDNELIADSLNLTHIQDNVDLVFGRRYPTSGPGYFNGALDEWSIWQRPLAEEEVRFLTNNPIPLQDPDLLLYYNFNEGAGSEILIDHSGLNNLGRIHNIDIQVSWTLQDGTEGGNQFSVSGDTAVCGSYVLGTDTLTSSGLHYVPLVSHDGCDSLVQVNLTVYPEYLFASIDSICENDSILFAGEYISMTGLYFDSLVSTLGCDSIYELDLVVLDCGPSNISDPNVASEISIHPNPFKDYLVVRIPEGTSVILSMFDLMGVKVLSKELNNTSIVEISPSLGPGVYIIEVGNHRQPFVKL